MKGSWTTWWIFLLFLTMIISQEKRKMIVLKRHEAHHKVSKSEASQPFYRTIQTIPLKIKVWFIWWNNVIIIMFFGEQERGWRGRKEPKSPFGNLKNTAGKINQEVGVLPQSLRSLQQVILMKPGKRPREDCFKEYRVDRKRYNIHGVKEGSFPTPLLFPHLTVALLLFTTGKGNPKIR